MSSTGSMMSLKCVSIVSLVLAIQIWWIYTMMSSSANTADITSWPEDLVYKLENGYTHQLDPLLAKFIYKRWLVPPSDEKLSLKDPQVIDHSQQGQSTFVDNLLKQKKGGFFVECGAGNGVKNSNSLFFERFRSWSGLLVEANPAFFKSILQTSRNAYSINACLSPSNASQKLAFMKAAALGGLAANMDDSHLQAVKSSVVKTHVQCFTLASILLSINQKHVDYFSLDVEGAELEILETIPWGVVHIEVLSVEYRAFGGTSDMTMENLRKVRQFLQQTGLYDEVGILPWDSHDNVESNERNGLDVLFKHK